MFPVFWNREFNWGTAIKRAHRLVKYEQYIFIFIIRGYTIRRDTMSDTRNE